MKKILFVVGILTFISTRLPAQDTFYYQDEGAIIMRITSKIESKKVLPYGFTFSKSDLEKIAKNAPGVVIGTHDSMIHHKWLGALFLKEKTTKTTFNAATLEQIDSTTVEKFSLGGNLYVWFLTTLAFIILPYVSWKATIDFEKQPEKNSGKSGVIYIVYTVYFFIILFCLLMLTHPEIFGIQTPVIGLILSCVSIIFIVYHHVKMNQIRKQLSLTATQNISP